MSAADTGRGPLTLTEVAAHLGVHYMTAYRYVRTGRLHAVKSGAEWRVRRDDLARFEAADRTATVRPAGRGASAPTRRTNWAERFGDRLVAGDEIGAWSVIDGALSSGMTAEETYVLMVGPAMAAIGEGWAAGRLTVADEHRATVVAQRVVGRMGPRFSRRGRKRGTIVVAAPPGETHALPVALFADLLRARGFDVADLGANVPIDALAAMVGSLGRLVAVGLCATTSDNAEAIGQAITALRIVTPAPVWVGGRAITSTEAARALGADGGGLPTVAELDAIETGLSLVR